MMLVLDLSLKAKKLGLGLGSNVLGHGLGLASSGLEVTGLVNNHWHAYHVKINRV